MADLVTDGAAILIENGSDPPDLLICHTQLSVFGIHFFFLDYRIGHRQRYPFFICTWIAAADCRYPFIVLLYAVFSLLPRQGLSADERQ